MIDGKLMMEVQQVARQGSGGQGGDAGGQQHDAGTEEEEEAFGAVRELRFVPDKNESCKYTQCFFNVFDQSCTTAH